MEELFGIQIEKDGETKIIGVPKEVLSIIMFLNETIKEKDKTITFLKNKLDDYSKQKRLSKFEIKELLKPKKIL